MLFTCFFLRYEFEDYKYDNNLKNSSPKCTNKAFLVPNWDSLGFFRKILQMGKFESADFKYDNSFLKILAPKHPNKAFLVPDLGIFIFSRNFAIRQIRGRWF